MWCKRMQSSGLLLVVHSIYFYINHAMDEYIMHMIYTCSGCSGNSSTNNSSEKNYRKKNISNWSGGKKYASYFVANQPIVRVATDVYLCLCMCVRCAYDISTSNTIDTPIFSSIHSLSEMCTVYKRLSMCVHNRQCLNSCVDPWDDRRQNNYRYMNRNAKSLIRMNPIIVCDKNRS